MTTAGREIAIERPNVERYDGPGPAEAGHYVRRPHGPDTTRDCDFNRYVVSGFSQGFSRTCVDRECEFDVGRPDPDGVVQRSGPGPGGGARTRT